MLGILSKGFKYQNISIKELVNYGLNFCLICSDNNNLCKMNELKYFLISTITNRVKKGPVPINIALGFV